MKREIFKKISLRVIIFLVIASILSFAGILIIKDRTAKLEEELAYEMEADLITPYFVDPVAEEGGETESITAAPSEVSSSETTEYLTETEEPTTIEKTTKSPKETTEETIKETTKRQLETTTEAESEEDSQPDETEETSTEYQTEAEPVETTMPATAEPELIQTEPVIPQTTVQITTPEPTTTAPTTTVVVETTTAAPTTTVAPTTTAAPTTEAPTEAPTEPPTQPAAPIPAAESLDCIDGAQLQLFKNRLLENINSLRSSMGLGKLKLNDCLISGSIVRSQEIVTAWSHTRPNGDRGIYVLADCGGWYKDAVNALKNGTPYNCALGENLAVVYSYSDYSGTDQELIELADEMFANWKASDSHYANMIYENFNYIGVGVTVNMDDGFHAFWSCTLFSN